MKFPTRALAIAFVAVAAAAASGAFAYRSGGPLAGNFGAGVKWIAKVGDRFTWAMPLPDNRTDSDLVLDPIDPQGVDGLEVLGVAVSNAGCTISSISLGYPAPGVPTQDVRGAVIPAKSQPSALQVLVGVSRTGPGWGRITALRVRYRHAGISYEESIPWGLQIVDPGS